MTIQEIKNNVALKLGYVGWHEIIDDHKLSDEIVDLLLTEQLNKPVVSVKRPLIEKILFDYMTNEKTYNETVNRILAACASGAVDKTVSDGLWCECGIPNRNTTSSQCGTCFKPIAGSSAGRF